MTISEVMPRLWGQGTTPKNHLNWMILKDLKVLKGSLIALSYCMLFMPGSRKQRSGHNSHPPGLFSRKSQDSSFLMEVICLIIKNRR